MSIFKAYDIRGIYPSELNEDLAYRIGRAFVSLLKPKAVAVGRDVRLSSESLFKELVRGITDQGADVVEIGLSSTPMLYFAVANFGLDAGINITASHNPGQYNGFKMVAKDAVPLSGDTGIDDIRKLVDKGAFSDSGRRGNHRKQDVLDTYAEHLLAFACGRRFENIHVVVDAGNAMAALVAPKIFEGLGCRLDELFFELDGSFPNHLPNPLEEKNLVALKGRVKKLRADLGLAFDGDADRLFFIDENGETVPADFIAALVAKSLLADYPGSTVLYDLRSSWVIPEEVKAAGGKAVMCRVGHSFIKRQMRDMDALFASELSAHFYFKHNFFVESPFFVVIKVLELMAGQGRRLSQLAAALRRYHHSGEINFRVKDRDGKDVIIAELKAKYADGRQTLIDGLRVDYDNYWFNVRPSNTEPLLRLNAEAKTKELLDALLKDLAAVIEES